MNITLKMNIQNEEFEINANLTNAAGRIYRQQFTRDILKDMTDIYKRIHRSPFEGIDLSGIDFKDKTEQEITEQILTKVDVTKVMENRMNLSALDFEETERCGQIIWAFVKNADKDTPNYEKWIDSYDFVLPVADIIEVLYEAWNMSAQPTIELKN